MVKCPKCKKGDLLMFLERKKVGQYNPKPEGDYEIIYKCTKCKEKITIDDWTHL
jgi:Zn ribbon nucleic-acid-binding protein